MANRLQLRRGTGAPGGVFHEGEPVYDKSGKVLYVGDDGASGSGNGSAVASASAYSSVVEILNQASSTSAAFIKLLEDSDNGNHNVSLKAPAAIASNYSLVLPDGTGSANQVLKTDGAGNLDWVDQSVGYTGFSITDGTNTESVDSGNTVTFTGGDGITAAVSSTDTLTISADLKANGGVVIESSELAVDLGASSITGTLAVSDGGTGATSASAARTALGLAIGSDVQAYDAQLADVAGLTPSDGGIIIGDGSNFVVESGATARTSLGVDAAGTDNSTNVTLVTTSHDYLSISGQAITLGPIDLAADVTGDLPVAEGGTGASNASDARTNLGLAIGSDVQAYDAQLADVAGLTPSDGGFIVGDGSNFVVESAATARTSLGVDAAGTDNSTNVTLAGSLDYITISGQEITRNAIDLAADVTGSLPNANLANSSITVSDGSNSTARALGDTLTIQGTANEVTVTESSGTVTVALPDDVTIGSDLTVTDKATAERFAGFDLLQAPYSGTTKTITVTVASKVSGEHRYHGTGSGSGYVLDGVQSPFLTLTPGRTYRFDTSDSSNSGHPFLFYMEADKTTQYTTNVTTNGTPGSAGAYTQIVVGDETPPVLHYQCSAHGYMGNAVSTLSNVVNSNYNATLRGTLTLGSSTAVSSVLDEDNMATNSATALATQQSIKAYVDSQVSAVDVTTDLGADSGSGSVSTSQTLTVQGTANEIVTSVSNQTITVALPDDVTIGNDLTVNGNLNVVGTAVTFSAETTRIEDRILELGLVNGAAPSSATTWDLGVAFNYNNSGAKKAGVVWLNNGFMAMLSELAESSDTGNADPQITATAYAPIAAGGLYLGGVASGNHIINSSGEAQNLVFDGGSY